MSHEIRAPMNRVIGMTGRSSTRTDSPAAGLLKQFAVVAMLYSQLLMTFWTFPKELGQAKLDLGDSITL